MSVLVEIFLDNRPVRANIVEINQTNGWVEIEDITAITNDPEHIITDPQKAHDMSIDDLTTPSIKLPLKKLYGNVKIVVLSDD